MNSFIQNFCELLEDTNPSDITATTNFKNLEEWSSLMALSLIAMIDENYSVTIGADDIRKANTLEDLFNIVQTQS